MKNILLFLSLVVFSNAAWPLAVVARNPVPNATAVPTNKAINVRFDVAMDAASITNTSILLQNTTTTALIPATVVYASTKLTATLTPNAALSPLTQYTVIVKGGGVDPRVKDASLNAMATDDTWNFTTDVAFVNNTITISNENNPANAPRIIKGGTYSSSSGDCISITNSSNIKIVGAKFKECWLDGVSISNSSNITVLGNYFEDTGGMVYALSTTGGIKILNNYSKNTMRRIGSARGQSIVQFNLASGAGNVVAGNYSFDDPLVSMREDAINVHQSYFSLANPLIIDGNIVRGSGVSTSSCGLIAGDGGGSFQTITNNTFYNPGQCGIGVAGGSSHVVSGNKVYGAQLYYSNIGIYTSKQPPGHPEVCTDITIGVNTIDWTRNTGTVNSIFNDTGTCAFASTASQITNQSLVNMALPTFGSFTPPVGLVAKYDFESACFACDFGGGNEGITNAQYMPVAQAGKIGDAAYFDGGDILTAPLSASDFTNNAFSFSVWVNRDVEAAPFQTVFSKENLKNVGMTLYDKWIFNALQTPSISTPYNYFMQFDNSTGANAGLIQDGQWAHIVLTYGAGVQKIYVNGTQVSSANRTKQQPSIFNMLQIGSAYYGKRFKGKIDGLMVFNTALSQADVTALYNQQVN